jgi:hypothetical protein
LLLLVESLLEPADRERLLVEVDLEGRPVRLVLVQLAPCVLVLLLRFLESGHGLGDLRGELGVDRIRVQLAEHARPDAHHILVAQLDAGAQLDPGLRRREQGANVDAQRTRYGH